VVKSYADGACSFITKPVGFAQFQEMVKQFEIYWVLVSRLPQAKSGGSR
jgi:FixJ family two-component response regulator